MSPLKYRLRKLLPTLSDGAKLLKNPDAKARLYLIKAVAASSKPISHTCERRSVSTEYFYTWAKRLLKVGSVKGLLSISKRPKRSPKKTSKSIERKIVRIRKAQPYLGPERVSDDLKLLYGVEVPPSTVYAILKREGLITTETKRALTKKHLRRYRRAWPGYLQMDFKYVPFDVNGEQYYQLSCVDHHSSWRLIRCSKNKDLIAVVNFLQQLEALCPFPIMQLQTDNDTAFTDKYRVNTDGFPTGLHALDLWCSKHGIEHKLIPIGQKELNGKVENTHKQDDREFYSDALSNTYESLRRATEGYNLRWNEIRRTRTLGKMTPSQVVELAYVRAIAWVRLLQEKFPNTPALTKINHHGNEYLPIVEIIPNKKKKAKQKSVVDRYLLWQDWFEKQRIKSWIIGSGMSLSSSVH